MSLKDEIAEVEHRLDRDRNLHVLANHPSWKHFSALLDSRMAELMARLIRDGQDHVETERARAEIGQLAWLTKSVAVDAQKLQELENRLAGLRKRAESPSLPPGFPVLNK